MARPGGNLTGVAILTADLNPKRFELLSELVPEAKVIAILVNPKNASADRVISDVQKAAEPKGIRIEVVRATLEAEYETAVAQARARAGALLVANDPVFFSHHERLVALAAKHAIPAAYEWREFVEAGGLTGRRVAKRFSRTRARAQMMAARVLLLRSPAAVPVTCWWSGSWTGSGGHCLPLWASSRLYTRGRLWPAGCMMALIRAWRAGTLEQHSDEDLAAAIEALQASIAAGHA
jgi:ABC-type uncharacterized transport system substrate-binding protein